MIFEQKNWKLSLDFFLIILPDFNKIISTFEFFEFHLWVLVFMALNRSKQFEWTKTENRSPRRIGNGFLKMPTECEACNPPPPSEFAPAHAARHPGRDKLQHFATFLSVKAWSHQRTATFFFKTTNPSAAELDSFPPIFGSLMLTSRFHLNAAPDGMRFHGRFESNAIRMKRNWDIPSHEAVGFSLKKQLNRPIKKIDSYSASYDYESVRDQHEPPNFQPIHFFYVTMRGKRCIFFFIYTAAEWMNRPRVFFRGVSRRIKKNRHGARAARSRPSMTNRRQRRKQL